jgi:hypothetical protein
MASSQVTTSQVDNKRWDAIVTAYTNQEVKTESSLISTLDDLYEQLTHGDESLRRQYCAVYIVLAERDEGVLGEVSSDYNDFLVGYNEGRGVKEMNRDIYTLRLFHAAYINDNEAIVVMRKNRPSGDYLDHWPGALRDLVKRRLLGDSTVKMDNVAILYPDTMIDVLLHHLNYKDLAKLLNKPEYENFRKYFARRVTSIAENNHKAFIEHTEQYPRNEDESINSYRVRMDLWRPRIANNSALTIFVLLNHYLALARERYGNQDNFPLQLYLNEAEAVFYFLSILTPTDASTVPDLVAYLVQAQGFSTPVLGGFHLTKMISSTTGRSYFLDILIDAYRQY